LCVHTTRKPLFQTTTCHSIRRLLLAWPSRRAAARVVGRVAFFYVSRSKLTL
jgi:hypothetical protein